MEAKFRILFFCEGNDCHSPIAEGWARALKSDRLEAWSAGATKTRLDPLAVRVMAEAGIDIHRQTPKTIVEMPPLRFDLVVCFGEEAHRRVPVLPGDPRQILLDIEDPRPRTGSAVQPFKLLDCYRAVRDEIREFVETLPEALVPANRKYYWIQPEFLRPAVASQPPTPTAQPVRISP